MERARSLRVLVLLGDGLPGRFQVPDVRREVGFANTVAGGPNDEAEVFRAQAFDDLAESFIAIVLP